MAEKISFSKGETSNLQDNPIEYAKSLSNEDILEEQYDPNKLNRKAEEFSVKEVDYNILDNTVEVDKVTETSYGKKVTKKHVNINRAASLMVGLTQKLIYQIDSENKEKEPLPDEIIYLDKSARPVSWLVNTFWDDFASKSEDGKTIKRPRHSYINIDRANILELFFHVVGNEKYGGLKDERGFSYDSYKEAWEKKKDDLSKEHFAQLRALYIDDSKLTDNITAEEIMQIPSDLDGKNILIIDEVEASGTTLNIAKELFAGAFPGCKVRSATFWHESAYQNTPPWYNDRITEGRGIGELDPHYREEVFEKYSDISYFSQFGLTPEEAEAAQKKALSRARAKKIGKRLLSAPLNLETENGRLSRKLMQDIKQLHKDYLSHKILPFAGNDDRFFIETVRQGVNPINLVKLKEKVFQ